MDDQPNDSKDNSKEGGKPKPKFSPFSPFPYGSPLAQGSLQTSFSGSPGQRLLIGSLNQSRTNGEIIIPRLKGQDLYGGPVMFGGLGSARRTRLQSASPYGAAMRNRNAERKARQGPLTFPPALGVHNDTMPPSSLPSTAPSSPQSSPGPSSTSPAPLSSTAKLILSTLDRLSSSGTPITDAKKIPLNNSTTTPNRAEKRKLLETELNCSLSSPSRRRARLGGGGLALALAGPPLRKNYSPSLGGPLRAQTQSVPPPAAPARLSTPQPAPPIQAPRPSVTEAAPTKAKSSFKVKAKVTESARQKVDLSSTEPPPSPPNFLSGLPQLKVDKMPVLNLTSTPAPPKPAPTTTNGVTVQPPRDPEIIEKNNNKSPQKRMCEEKGNSETNSPKKQKSAGLGGLAGFSSTQHSQPQLDNSTSANGSKSALPVNNAQPTNPPPKFSFSAPKSVMDQAEAPPQAEKKFSFSSPTIVKISEKATMTNGPSKLGDKSCSSPNFRVGGGLVNSKPSLNTNFQFNNLSSMPDVTNNLVKKSPNKSDKLKGSNSSSRLPDITASTGFSGFIPARELKSGSVMDILGKKA